MASTLHEKTPFVALHHYILIRSGLETKLLRVAIPGILAAQRNSGGKPLSFFGWQTAVQHQKQIRLHQSVQKAAAKLPEAIQQFINEKYNAVKLIHFLLNLFHAFNKKAYVFAYISGHGVQPMFQSRNTLLRLVLEQKRGGKKRRSSLQ